MAYTQLNFLSKSPRLDQAGGEHTTNPVRPKKLSRTVADQFVSFFLFLCLCVKPPHANPPRPLRTHHDRTCQCAVKGNFLFPLRVEFLLKTDGGYPMDAEFNSLRVEFLLKTDSGYPRDAEVTLFTLANPEHSLRFNTHWSAPPVSALARSGGPRKMTQSSVSRNSNIVRLMDRPRAVVRIIRGVT